MATNDQFNFRMTPEEYAALTTLAHKHGLKLGAMLRLLIRAAYPSPWPPILFDGAVLAAGSRKGETTV